MSNEQQQPTEAKGGKIPVGAVSIILTLGLLFLQVSGVINISWWWVFSPVIAAVGLVAAIALITIILAALGAVVFKAAQK